LAAIDVHVTRYGPDPDGRTFAGLPSTPARRAIDLFYRSVTSPKVPRALNGIGSLIFRLEGWLNAVHLARRFDVLVFGYGVTPTDTALELALYRLLGKRMVVILHGTDARPPFLNEAYAPAARPIEWEKLHHETQRIAERMARFERYADEILAYPAVSHFFTRELVDWYRIGKPLTVKDPSLGSSASSTVKGRGLVRIGHGPTRPSTKGTEEIATCIAELAAEGWPVEFVVPEQYVTKDQLHEILSTCDLVIDQLWADVPGATVAAEALELGLPVIVGLRDVAFFTAWYPERARAMNFISPDELKEELLRLLRTSENQGLRMLWTGNQGADQVTIARRYLDIFTGNGAERWRFDPTNVLGVFGFGPPERVHEIAAGYLDRFGTAAFMLNHRPELQRLIEDWAASGRRQTDEFETSAGSRPRET
jgi:hypothetical protein